MSPRPPPPPHAHDVHHAKTTFHHRQSANQPFYSLQRCVTAVPQAEASRVQIWTLRYQALLVGPKSEGASAAA
jgi:hypothetical protein